MKVDLTNAYPFYAHAKDGALFIFPWSVAPQLYPTKKDCAMDMPHLTEGVSVKKVYLVVEDD